MLLLVGGVSSGSGACLDCYRGLELCLFSGQCIETDAKYVPMDRLRRLILRDCPIPNAGPCPKVKNTVSPTATCDCPEVKQVQCQCPVVELVTVATVKTTIPTTSASTTSTATTTTASTTMSACQKELVECEKSLLFTGTAKAGAQQSRKVVNKDLEELVTDFGKLNFTRYHFENKSIDLATEVRTCQTNKGKLDELVKELVKGWRQTNVTLAKAVKDITNLTKLWDDCTKEKGDQEAYTDDLKGNLTICWGDLGALQAAAETSEQIVPQLQQANKGKFLFQ